MPHPVYACDYHIVFCFQRPYLAYFKNATQCEKRMPKQYVSMLIFILTNDPLHMFKKILEYVVPKITVFFPPDVTSLRTSRIFRHFVIRKTIVNRECPKATYKIVI